MDIEWRSEVNFVMCSDNPLKIRSIEEIFGLDKQNNSLLQALTHPSALNESPNTYTASYERMEFLGDALIDLVVANELYSRLPRTPEGELSKLRASIVNGETLAKIAKELQLGKFIIMGQGSGDSGGRKNSSILAFIAELSYSLDLISSSVISFLQSRIISLIRSLIFTTCKFLFKLTVLFDD